MKAEILAEWLRGRKHRVIRTESSFWYDAGPLVFQAFPYHWTIKPSKEELRRVLLKNNAIALRYSTPIATPCGKISYHVVCEDQNYDLSSLSRQARQNVKRGLKYAVIEPISFSRLASEGWSMRQDTLKRQGRTGAETEEWWHQICTSAQDLSGFQAWGAINDGKLVASFLAFRCDDCFTLAFEQSATGHLRYRINNAIFYAVTRAALKREGISFLFAGLHSLDAPASLDHFKFHMGYKARPVRQRVVFHPLLAPMLNKTTQGVLRHMIGRLPPRPFLTKMEGMMRFYMMGNCSPEEQDWPECLADRKLELLEAIKIQGGIKYEG